MRRLLTAYAVVTLVPTLLLGAVLAGVLERQADQRGLDQGLSKAKLVARTTIAPLLDGDTTRLSQAEFDRLDRSVRLSVRDGQVLRMQLRDLAGHVVFSDEGVPTAAEAAEVDDDALEAAAGETVVEMTRLGADDPSGDARGPRAVEVYLPLDSAVTGERIGVVELYLPYAPIAADIARGQRTVLVTLGAGLLLLWVCLTLVSVSVIRHLRRESAAHAWLASHDQLTGLANRARFSATIADTVRHGLSGPAGRQLTVAVLDLDRFSQVNDALGHANADELLVTMARRLEHASQDAVGVARLAGDEFGILLGADVCEDEVPAVLQAVRETLHEPVIVAGFPVAVTSSVGYATASAAEGDHGAVLRQAYVALAAAKRDRRGLLGYSPGQDGHDAAALELVSQMGPAIREDQLVLHYQPKYDVRTRRVSSVEALVRWQHPRLGLLYPDKFIDAVEQTELIDELTRWVLQHACAAAGDLAAYGDLPVAVNISARSLVRTHFAAEVIELVGRSGLTPDRILLEITETAVVTDPARATANLERLHQAGFGISVDDFGAGQTSLGQLVSMRVDELKIDRAFVMRMLEDDRNAAIVRAVIELGHSLGLAVTAEGVESAEVLRTLTALDCDTAQGYFLSRPVPLGELLSLLGPSRTAHDEVVSTDGLTQ